MIKITCWFEKKKKYLINSQIKRVEDITRLDKEINPDNSIYRYKRPISDVKPDEFDKALNLLEKIKIGEISVAKAKSDQTGFKSNLCEIEKG